MQKSNRIKTAKRQKIENKHLNIPGPQIALEFALTLSVWGLVSVAIKSVSTDIVLLGIIRLSLGLACLAFIPKLWSGLKQVKKEDLPILFAIGATFAFHWVTFFYSIRLSSPVIGVLGTATYGIHLMLLTMIIRKKSIGPYDLLALLLAVAGTIILIPEFSLNNQVSKGILVGIFSGFLFAIMPFLHQKKKHLNNLTRCFFQFSVGLATLLLLSFNVNWHIEKHDIPWLLFLGIGGTFIVHLMWTRISTILPTKTTSTIYYLTVPAAMLWSFIILNDTPTRPEIIGGGLIVLGSIIAVRRSSTGG